MDGQFRRTWFWTADFFQGSPVYRHYADMARVWHSELLLEDLQKDRLSALLEYAGKNSPFYRKYAGADFYQFPVVDKNRIRENLDLIRIEPRLIPYQKGPVHIQRTSGSTGTPFAIPQDTRKRIRRLASLKFFGNLAGFRSHETLVQCRIWNKWQSKNSSQIFWQNIFPFDVSRMDDDAMKEVCDLIDRRRAAALLSYGNWWDRFAAYLEKSGRKLPSLKVMISSSDLLKESTRLQFIHLLGRGPVDRYANEESGMLGQTLRERSVDPSGRGGYYLDHSSCRFEVLKFDSDEPVPFGELGRLVITDFFNYALPLIRYDTGDTAILESGDSAGHGHPFLRELFGRRYDMIFDTAGAPVSPMAVSRMLKNFPNILQWQFVQKGRKEYLLRVNLKESSADRLEIDEFKGFLGSDAVIQVENVDEIPVLASGKRKPILNEMNH